MRLEVGELSGLVVLTPRVFEDERGSFYESFNTERFRQLTGIDTAFVQDNHSTSRRGVIRGLHYQLPPVEQGKLVRVVAGRVFDVAVDIRRSSPTFGHWAGIELSAVNRLQLWIPGGFAHGFLALEDGSEVIYKTTSQWSAAHERAIRWDDDDLAIAWPVAGDPPLLSPKDVQALGLLSAEVFP